ncbi:MAG: DUF2029 domain-containing protein [Anaerolineales bacterium]|nr:DUF2029 domain-containing protein [Anaerolineales bacterium]
MTPKQTYLLIFFLIFFWLLMVSVLFNNLSHEPEKFIRWFNDHNDRLAYAENGLWLAERKIPYRDVPSEYPQIPTYLFGLPYLFIPRAPETTAYFWHSSIVSLLMLILLFFVIRLLYNALAERKWRAWLMLLPASLYFTYNRFDILPALICLAAYLAITSKRSLLAGILLGVGTFTKWYPALLLPLFLSYEYSLHKRISGKLVLGFLGACILIVIPTLITAGWEGFLSPYRMQAGRGVEQVSLPALLTMATQRLGWTLNLSWTSRVFMLLQFLPALAAIFGRIETEKRLLQWIILTTGAFILFSPIFSPQWILWLMPFLILNLKSFTDLLLIVLYNLFAYLAFPVGMDLTLKSDTPYHAVFVLAGIAVALCLAIILARAFVQAHIRFSWNLLERLMLPKQSNENQKRAQQTPS